MNVSLPDNLRAFVDEQVASGGAGAYVGELIQREHDRATLRSALLEGASSPVEGVADRAFFDALRQRVWRERPEP
jgi:antitoxin ParD1/3/4